MSDEPMTPEAEEAAFAPMTALIRALEAGRDAEQHALRNALGQLSELQVWNRNLVAARNLLSKESREANAEIAALRADLARALPIVEAAGAVVEQLKYWGGAPVGVPEWRAACDALAAAVRAARDPRTGEGT